jgi:transposase
MSPEDSMKPKKLPTSIASPPPFPTAQGEGAGFSDEFKRSAVERMRMADTNVTALALELGVRRNLLYKWAKALDARGPGTGFRGRGRLPADQESEIVRLRRELAKANEELAILKKFDAYLTRRKM